MLRHRNKLKLQINVIYSAVFLMEHQLINVKTENKITHGNITSRIKILIK